MNDPISKLFLDVCEHLKIKIIIDADNKICNKGYIDKTTNKYFQDGDIKLLDISYGIAFLLSPEDEDEQNILSSWQYAISKGISTINKKELDAFLLFIKPLKKDYQNFIKLFNSYESDVNTSDALKLNNTIKIFKNYCEYFERKIAMLTKKKDKKSRNIFKCFCFKSIK